MTKLKNYLIREQSGDLIAQAQAEMDRKNISNGNKVKKLRKIGSTNDMIEFQCGKSYYTASLTNTGKLKKNSIKIER